MVNRKASASGQEERLKLLESFMTVRFEMALLIAEDEAPKLMM